MTWKVHIIGDRGEFELSILKVDNEHGQKSWGWDDLSEKLVIASFESPDLFYPGDKLELLKKQEFQKLIDSAQKMADSLNTLNYQGLTQSKTIRNEDDYRKINLKLDKEKFTPCLK